MNKKVDTSLPMAINCDDLPIASLLKNELSHAAEKSWLEHVGECEQCQRRLEEHSAAPQLWTEACGLLSSAEDLTAYDQLVSKQAAHRYGFTIQTVLDSLAPTDDPTKLGRLGNYEVSGVVGSGGMGVVLKAMDPSLDRTVAIKVLAPHLAGNAASRERFAREAKSAAAVLHPNIIAIHGVFHEASLPWIVMPYLRGESLQQRIDAQGALPIAEVLRIGVQVADGLAAAHAHGLVHRDIKPANILLEDGVERVTITDFGLARTHDDATLTVQGALAGTPTFMSPEQAKGDHLTPATDLYSLGALLYACATGKPPFAAETTYGIIRKVCEDTPASMQSQVANCPQWLSQIVARLMAKRSIDRYASAVQVADLLRQCLAHVEQPALFELPVELQKNSGIFDFAKSPFGRRVMLGTTAVAICLALFAFLFPTAPINPQAGDSAEREKTKQSETLASAVVDGYRIEANAIEDVRGQQMSSNFDTSRMRVEGSMNERSESKSGQFGNATNGATFSGSGSGFGAGAGGGSGAVFMKPNFGLALRVTPIRKRTQEVVEIGTKAAAYDTDDKLIDQYDVGPTVHHFYEFEQHYPGQIFLYFANSQRGVPNLKRVEGELRITPGAVWAVEFEGTKPQSQDSPGGPFKLSSATINNEGIQAVVELPISTRAKKARNPMESFQARLASRGAIQAWVEDYSGQRYNCLGYGSSGEMQFSSSYSSSSTFSQGGRSGRMSMQSSGGTPKNPSMQFKFPPLKSGQKFKSIHIEMTDRTGDARTVPFVLNFEQ